MSSQHYQNNSQYSQNTNTTQSQNGNYPYSYNQSEAQSTNQGTQNQDVKQINFQEYNLQKPKWMYKYFWNRYENNWKFNTNFMFPVYYKYFKDMQKTLMELAQTCNKKWTEQQRKAYVTFLTDVNNYIKAYIWTKQILDFNMFTTAMRQYSQFSNPIGAQLYDNQLEYLHKKSIGYDFFQDKKKKKQQKQQTTTKKFQEKKTQQPVAKQIRQKKEQQSNRSPDPTINIHELRARKWPEDKYTNFETFLKPNANIVFIGHVDSGKSTLTGNILKQLNQVDEQEWIRNKQQAKQNHMQAWQLAGISDVDPTERQKGITIQYAKLNFSYGQRRFTLFDAPGHKNYVPNMIMGACQADIAVLIISSKIGQFQAGFQKGGQTRQHALLAKALGVSSIVVAVTKMSTNDWDLKRYNQIKDKVFPFLKQVCGYSEVKFIPLDSITNLNVHKKIQNSWYKGQYFLQALQKIDLPQRNVKGPLRIPIIDKFKDAGNLFIYGKVESGSLIQNQTVTLLPQRKQFSIRQIFNAKDQRLPYAIAGQNVKLKIKGLQQDQIKRGNMICNNNNYCLQSQEFKALITVVELPQQKKLLSTGYEGVIHMHAISQNIQISKIQSKINKQNQIIPAKFLLPGQKGHAIIKVQNPICLQKFEFMPNLGRFTLRDEGKTIGYGEVLKIKPAKTLMKEQREQLGGQKKQEQTK